MRNTKLHTTSGCIAIAFLMLSISMPAWSAGGAPMNGGSNFNVPAAQRTPADIAKSAYNSGIGYLKDAKEYEQDALKATDPKKIAKAQAKAQKAYKKAFNDFSTATQKVPGMFEAWNYVGFTERHLGNYDAALTAYAKALELKPNYPEALEYRGEAFLGLNALDDAKQAYSELFLQAPPLATQLLMAMHSWVDKQRQNPSGVDAAGLDAFAAWLTEREAQAKQSADTRTPLPARW